MDDRYRAPHIGRARTGQSVGRVLLKGLYGARVLDAHQVPASGPLILVSNHLGLLDGPILFCVAQRPANIIVKRELFHGPLGTLLRGVGQIPIDRTTGDRRALMTAVSVLEQGRAVGVFPEGTRGRGDVSHIHQGATWLALRTGAPVIPVALLGTRKRDGRGSLPTPRSRMYAVFGQPFELEGRPGLPARDQRRLATERMRVRLADHVHASSQRVGTALPERAPSDVSDNG